MSRLRILAAWVGIITATGMVWLQAIDTQAVDTPSEQRVLLLRTGRILKGNVREISTGWLVSRSNGHAVIPVDQVRFAADSLEDVYLRLRLEMRNPTPGTHLRLADWCFSQKLYSEATRELRDALKLDPSNETARIMLHRLEQEIRRQSEPENSSPKEPAYSTGVLRIGARRTGNDLPEARSLAGLSRETADSFVTRLQPLLANKCGNARCHGSAARNSFRLEHVPTRSGSFRLRVERNLAAVLRFIDPEAPLQSPLLDPVDLSHGGRTIFSGRFGAEQAEVLQDWTLAAAAELQSRRSRQRRSVVSANPAISPSTPTDTSPDGNPADRRSPDGTAQAPPFEPDSAAVTQSVREDTSDRRLSRFQQLLIEVEDAAEEVDVFDPEEFNRRYAVQPGN